MVMHSKVENNEHVVVNYVGGLELRIAAITNTGKKRENNEDNFAIAVPTYEGEISEALIVVADGMGGHSHGEIASEIVVDTYKQQFTEETFSLLAAAQEADMEIQKRNAELSSELDSDVESGSTVVALHLRGNSAIFHHAGDSRLYRYANGQLEQLTTDHTLVNKLVNAGKITPEEAKTHPHRNVITNCLGVGFREDMSEPETNGLEHPERYLLCTDGLTEMLDDRKIGEILLRQDKPVDEIATMLVDAANEKGGKDNITVAVVDVVQRGDAYERLHGVEPRDYLQRMLEPPVLTAGIFAQTLEDRVGTLAETVPLFKKGTIQTSAEIQIARLTDESLRNTSFYTANYCLYDLEKDDFYDQFRVHDAEGEAVLYFGGRENNPIFSNLEEACRQLNYDHNYFPSPEETASAKRSALRVKLADLSLQRENDEFSYYEISTSNYNALNSAQRRLAEAVHGSYQHFVNVMDMLNRAGIGTTRIYVLNPEYVKRRAIVQAVCRVSWLNCFNNSSDFSAIDRNVNYHGAVRGVLMDSAEGGTQKTEALAPAVAIVPPPVPEEITPSVAPASLKEITPATLEQRTQAECGSQRFTDRIREDYNIIKTYLTSQEFREQMSSLREAIGQRIAEAQQYFRDLSPLSRERFKKGYALLEEMTGTAIEILGRTIDSWFEMEGGSPLSVYVEVDEAGYRSHYNAVASRYFASQQGRPHIDKDAIDSFRAYVTAGNFWQRMYASWQFGRVTRGETVNITSALKNIHARTDSDLAVLIHETYALNTDERQATFVLAKECGFVDWEEEKTALAIDFTEEAKTRNNTEQDTTRQIQFLLKQVKEFYEANDLEQLVVKQEAGSMIQNNILAHTEGVILHMQGMKALQEGKLAEAEDKLQAVLRRDDRYLQFVGINMEEVYVGLGRVYYSQRKFDKLRQLFDEHSLSAKIIAYKQEVIRDWYLLAQTARDKKDHADAREYYKRILLFDSQQPRAHFLVGETYYQTGKQNEAIPHYQRAIAADPTLSFAPLHLAQCYYKARRYDDLHALFTYYEGTTTEESQRLAQYKRDVINDWYELGQKAKRSGDTGDAKEYYRRILRFDASQTRARDILRILK